MSHTRTVAVFGSTGSQGGGLARAILSDTKRDFAVRAITRNPQSEKARELAKMGAEVVAADVDDPASVEAALRGATHAYFVTFYWAHLSPEKEQAEARTFASAAKSAGLQHVIWSTLEDTRTFVPLHDDRMPTLQGKYKVPHFDGKAEADQYFTSAGVPTTFLLASFYWDNLIFFGLEPQRGADGRLHLGIPIGNAKMAGIAAEDIGKCAYGIFRSGTEMVGRKIGVAGEQLTGAEMAASLTTALGEEVVYSPMTHDGFRGLGFPGADDVGNMFQIYTEFADELNKTRDVAMSRELNPELQTFDQFLARNAKRIPIK